MSKLFNRETLGFPTPNYIFNSFSINKFISYYYSFKSFSQLIIQLSTNNSNLDRLVSNQFSLELLDTQLPWIDTGLTGLLLDVNPYTCGQIKSGANPTCQFSSHVATRSLKEKGKSRNRIESFGTPFILMVLQILSKAHK